MIYPTLETLAAGETSTIHIFERAGLGKAPFRFVGMTEMVITYPDGSSKAGGTCDYCGAGIRYAFHCESTDGNKFAVGCDCIHKIGDRGLIKQISRVEREMRDAKNKIARERKAARKADRIEAAIKTLPTVRGILAEQPHPFKGFADEGKTLLDYVRFCLDNSAGERAAAIIEAAAK